MKKGKKSQNTPRLTTWNLKEHNALNNALHDLQLSIDRSHHDTQPPPSAGLEFLLRAVADDVSSIAPGARGGILNQIREFNALLERVGEALEKRTGG